MPTFTLPILLLAMWPFQHKEVAPASPTPEAKIAFWKAQFEFQQALPAYQAALKKVQDARDSYCLAPFKLALKDGQFVLDAKGDPTCESAPEPKK